MGCGASRQTLERVDDSVHVMLAHEKKVAMKKGQSVATAYVPRADHPLLQARPTVTAVEDEESAAAVENAAAPNLPEQ